MIPPWFFAQAPPEPRPILLLWAFFSIVLLIILVARFRLSAFLALIISSIALGLMTGLPAAEIAKGFGDGVGAVLGSIAVVIGLGAILGKMVSVSGGAGVIAGRFLEWWGEKHVSWAILLLAVMVGMSVFFAVGLVVLFPIVVMVAHRSRLNMVQVGIPMLAGLSVMHGLTPPHAGPMAAIGLLQADVGKTLLYSLIVAIPTAVIAGPILGSRLARSVYVPSEPLATSLNQEALPPSLPSFGTSVLTLFLPVLLMCMATVAQLIFSKDGRMVQVISFFGSPIVALLAGVLLSFYTFGRARGFTAGQLLKWSEECLGPVGAVLLVVGAGGGFSRVLTLSGVGDTLAGLLKGVPISPLVLAWLVAAIIRVALGSATVAITTAAALVVPFLASDPSCSPELMVVALGAGSLVLSHVNDGGFWLVKEFFQMSVSQMLKTWTVMDTVISVMALILLLCLEPFVR